MIKSELDPQLRAKLVAKIRNDHEEEALKHEPSGKLSAGQLGKPLLEQCLKVIGVNTASVDDYALGLFRRGNSVEDTIIELLEPDETQVPCEYKGCVGVIDAIKDNRVYEIKSIKNSAVSYIDPDNKKRAGSFGAYSGVKYAHTLQAGLYALALNKPDFTIIYASADDLRTYPHLVKTIDIAEEIETIIAQVDNQLKTHTLPKWAPREEWQAKYPQYSSYQDWMTLEPELMMEKLKNQYSEAYKKLLNYK